jgi:hypothetical protein
VAATAGSSIRASKILKDEIYKLKQDISLAEGKTNQAIQRKGVKNLMIREIKRR